VAEGMNKILLGDALEQLRTLADNSVHCCVTSPPYFGLRDYGVEGQIGLEKTPEEFIAKMVAIFRELRRVLRDDGTLWLNMGDSYAGSGKGGKPEDSPHQKQATNRGSAMKVGDTARQAAVTNITRRDKEIGYKPKDLMGMPWRLALALQADGWWLRADIIWAKPNPMPSSVTDRPTTAHEYIFLLTKSAHYFYDEFAVREASVTNDVRRPYGSKGMWDMDGRPEGQQHGGEARGKELPETQNNIRKARAAARNGKNAFRGQGAERDGASGPANRDDRDMSTVGIGATRNMRSVWTMATEPFPDAHFATFPTALPAKCIAAGTSERGVCPQCGAPWVRIVEKSGGTTGKGWHDHQDDLTNGMRGGDNGRNLAAEMYDSYGVKGAGWRAGCDHGAEPVPAVVLDPFFGAGTTGVVARRMGRSFVGIELNPAYIAIAEKRLGNINPLFA
jgi:DNA modification methylase